MPDGSTLKLGAGLHDGVPNDDYHGDVCLGPSMSSSNAVTLMAECPEAAWFDSYLNPERPTGDRKILELGKASHIAVLEPQLWASQVAIVDANDWKTKAAQVERDRARSAQLIPILGRDAGRITAMAMRVHKDPDAGPLLTGGRAESSLFWQDPETALWCKARPDYRRADGRRLVDYKTAPSANPRAFERHAYAMGYFQQAAWYCEAEAAVTGAPPDEYLYIVQERSPPFIVTAMRLRANSRALERGHALNLRARAIWAECLRRGEWPAYKPADHEPGGSAIHDIDLPSFAEFQLEERRETPRLANDLQDVNRTWADAQAPI